MWERLNTPPHPCREDWLDRSYELAKITSDKLPASPSTDYAYAYSDLNVSYRYSQVQCILLHQQLDIIDKCHCQYVFNPRPRHPNYEVPYCGRILDNDTNLLELIMQRIECLSGGPLNNSLKRHYEATSCFPRCSYYTYDSTISVTTWRAVDWQLHWLRQLNNAFKAMRHDQSTRGENWPVNRSKGYAKWIEYYEKTNLTNIPQNAIQDLNLEGNNFAYVVLKRRSGDVKVNKEKLVLSISVLLSRIGGLCSLTIGLTAAFVVEMIEFAYLLCTNKKTNTEKCTMKNNCKRSKNSPTTNPVILFNKPTSTMNQSESLLRPGPLSAADDPHDFELGDSNG
ncbi:hypothetical protein P879_11951 [Paragonimus westermani]|uniref:Uncharacterized protein n=1 Tax=Paragonimus westermani TaxID=34504 RepID=A0A8T0D2Z5_9TREM|nr:hypothetical protein P879_11951 [Paragonimus westermani]